MRHVQRIGAAALTTVLVVVGCAQQRVSAEAPGGAGGSPDLEPSLTIERFLRSANEIARSSETDGAGAVERLQHELDVMTRLFGTREGPIRDLYPRAEVEQRMFALATILRHEQYAIGGTRLVPGRIGEAIEITVRMDTREGTVPVPFVVVRGTDGRWRIEQIAVERLTSGV